MLAKPIPVVGRLVSKPTPSSLTRIETPSEPASTLTSMLVPSEWRKLTLDFLILGFPQQMWNHQLLHDTVTHLGQSCDSKS